MALSGWSHISLNGQNKSAHGLLELRRDASISLPISTSFDGNNDVSLECAESSLHELL
jgi:hypothetical protein